MEKDRESGTSPAAYPTWIIRSKMPCETEKDLHFLFTNTGGLVYNPKSSTAYSCSNDDTLT
jgi:hypothetical protein